MIKINNISGQRDLEKLAEEHYNKLHNFLSLSVKYISLGSKNTRNSSIKKYSLHKETAKAIAKRLRRLEISLRSNLREFCEDLLINNFEKLKNIILCIPQNMTALHATINSKYNIEDDKVNEILKIIFAYDKFSTGITDKQDKYSAYNLCSSLHIPVCPYCNRIYISTLENGKKTNDNGKSRKRRPPLDHFYPRSKYPIFGLSFYNLIPSCTFCNSSLKSDEDFNAEDYVHPYQEGFGDSAKFCYKADSSQLNNLGIELKIDKTEKTEKKERIVKSDETFEIEVLYQENHQDISEEIYDKNLANSSEYRDSLFSIIADLKPTEEEFYQFYFGNYMDEKDHEKRPLAKFTKDLVDDLGIMEKIKV